MCDIMHFQCHTITPQWPSLSWWHACAPASINCKSDIHRISNWVLMNLLFWTQKRDTFVCNVSSINKNRKWSMCRCMLPSFATVPVCNMQSLWSLGPRGQWHPVTCTPYYSAKSAPSSESLRMCQQLRNLPWIPFSTALHLHNHKILIQAYAKLFLSPH